MDKKSKGTFRTEDKGVFRRKLRRGRRILALAPALCANALTLIVF